MANSRAGILERRFFSGLPLPSTIRTVAFFTPGVEVTNGPRFSAQAGGAVS